MSELLGRYQESFDYVASGLRADNIQPRFVMQNKGHIEDIELDETDSLDDVIINPAYFVDAAHMFIPLAAFAELLKREGFALKFNGSNAKKLAVYETN
tara:strand:+ start:5802 stop:6095 length:294 start_codon:yes stop_codon:yes gene_type:complete